MENNGLNFWQSFWKRWREEWQHVKDVRRPFLTLLAMGLSVGWGLGVWIIYVVVSMMFETRIANKDSTIQNLETRVSSYESRLNVSTPSEAEEKIMALQDEITKLQDEITQLKDITPHLQILDKEWIEDDDGSWVLQYKTHSATKLTPNGLLLSFDAEGITNLAISPLNAGATHGGKVDRGHDISYYIQKPFGFYILRLRLTEKGEVTFTWAYDGFPGESDVSR